MATKQINMSEQRKQPVETEKEKRGKAARAAEGKLQEWLRKQRAGLKDPRYRRE